MVELKNINSQKFENLQFNDSWAVGATRERLIHRIHSYPAKFPAFITEKALRFADEEEKLNVSKVADVFCGCGTVAYEAKRNNVEFWGCDINPVATLIANVKSNEYQSDKIQSYYDEILSCYVSLNYNNPYHDANPRLKYWYNQGQYNDLFRLKESIVQTVTDNEEYQSFFLCAFSNILKSSSKWLTKSIKPQVNPNKKPKDVSYLFQKQIDYMIRAYNECDVDNKPKATIETGNLLELEVPTDIDMIISSPPYVTSYEYADLHQLSTLWLDYAEDFREFRKGSIGSIHNDFDLDKHFERINEFGKETILALQEKDKAKTRSVAKYFFDMQEVIVKCHHMLKDAGLALFVIGNTEYKGVRIDNTRHLAESMKTVGFKPLWASKRKISNKMLTPYRDKYGRFTSNKIGRKIYSEEFIIIGRKNV